MVGPSILSYLQNQQPDMQPMGGMNDTQPDMVQQILSSRFQPTAQDVGNSALAGVASNSYINPQQYANTRVSDAVKQMSMLGEMQKNLAMANVYNQGGPGNATIKAAQSIMAENPGMSFSDAFSFAKSGLGQGVTYQNGGVTTMPGAPQAAGAMKQGESMGSALGKEQGERTGTLNAMTGSLPQGEATVNALSQLGQKATYTIAGKVRDSAVRQMGMGATEGAQARQEYIATARDVLFPQLRQTFGAQFTAKEGEALLSTLGDPDLSPEEKDATLRAFIDQKKQGISSIRRELGQSPMSPQTAQPPGKLIGTSGGKAVYELPDGSHVMEE